MVCPLLHSLQGLEALHLVSASLPESNLPGLVSAPPGPTLGARLIDRLWLDDLWVALPWFLSSTSLNTNPSPKYSTKRHV